MATLPKKSPFAGNYEESSLAVKAPMPKNPLKFDGPIGGGTFAQEPHVEITAPVEVLFVTDRLTARAREVMLIRVLRQKGKMASREYAILVLSRGGSGNQMVFSDALRSVVPELQPMEEDDAWLRAAQEAEKCYEPVNYEFADHAKRQWITTWIKSNA